MTPNLPAQIAAAKRDMDKAIARYHALLRKLPITSGPKGPMKERNLRAILVALELSQPLSTADMVNNTRLHRTTVHRLISEMLIRGMIVRHYHGMYGLPKGHASVLTDDEKTILQRKSK